jgi:hypothetical protein
MWSISLLLRREGVLTPSNSTVLFFGQWLQNAPADPCDSPLPSKEIVGKRFSNCYLTAGKSMIAIPETFAVFGSSASNTMCLPS